MSTYILNNFRALPATSPEVLTRLNLPETDVLTRDEDIRVRRTCIAKAMSLARSDSYETSIIIKCAEGFFKIVDAVTGHDETTVFTKSGLRIPVRAICSVDFYLK